MADPWQPQMWTNPSSGMNPLQCFPPPPTDGIKREKNETSEYGGEYPEGGYEPFFPTTVYPNAPSVPHSVSVHHNQDEQFKRDKEAIYSHPFFPLLTCLFTKCELATCTPRDSSREGTNEVVSAASFKEDLEQFTKTMETSEVYYTPNEKLDELMIQAITMLRFHMLELEKVHELCDNFCQRYVARLKQQAPIDIVGDERASSSNTQISPMQPASPAMNSNMGHYPSSQPPYEPQTVPLPESTMTHNLEGVQSSSYTTLSSMGQDMQSLPLAMDGSVMAVSAHTSNNSSAISPSASSSGGARNGSTPLYDPSAINPNPASIDSTETGSLYMEYPFELSSRESLHPSDPLQSSLSPDSARILSKKRGIFPKAATNVMRQWLFKHLTHPYPSEDQKKQLANDTGLTILQVNNWFINARRRIVQPMIDQSNRAGRAPLNVFRGRRRDRDSGGETPDASTNHNSADAVSSTAYSPDPSTTVPAMPTYPPGDLSYMQRTMFPYPPFGATMSAPFMMPSMFPTTPSLAWPMDHLSTSVPHMD